MRDEVGRREREEEGSKIDIRWIVLIVIRLVRGVVPDKWEVEVVGVQNGRTKDGGSFLPSYVLTLLFGCIVRMLKMAIGV